MAKQQKTAPRKRGGLGANPLDSIVPVQAPSKAKRRDHTATPPRHATSPKGRYTIHLPVGLMERAKNATYWTPGLTLAGLAEAGIRTELERVEKKHGPFKPRERELVGGRPLGA